MNIKRCSNCKFMDRREPTDDDDPKRDVDTGNDGRFGGDGTFAYCRRYAPRSAFVQDTQDTNSWPLVRWTDYCGEYQAGEWDEVTP